MGNKNYTAENYNEFMLDYSLENLQKMSLEEYVRFYRIITYTSKKRPFFGSIRGFDPILFGIYQANQKPKDESVRYKEYNGNSYAWKGNEDDPLKAYETIRNIIVKIAEEAQNIDKGNDLSKTLKNIEEIEGLSQCFKWKIAFLYSGQKLIDWYSQRWLRKFIEKLDPENELESYSTARMQLKLMEIRTNKYKNNKGKFNNVLYNIFKGNIMPEEPNKTTDKFVELLKNSYNLILHGAPGTGKTYLAKNIVESMKKQESIEVESEMVQFHSSYDYTDFVEGIRPTLDAKFERKDGVFKKFCEKALKSLRKEENKKFIFIIDEINRGELSKIFGELFYSIDPDYRVSLPIEDEDRQIIRTQYANMATQNEFDEALGIDDIEENKDNFGHFFVPENVYIIGTMNDIDRSVESMDLAMRRRFTFFEIKAEENLGMLEQISDKETKEKAKQKIKSLNKAIKETEGLSDAYQIGGAYFLKLNNFKDEDDKFQKLWDYNLAPLLKEYLRGQDPDGEKLKKLEDAYKNDKNSKD